MRAEFITVQDRRKNNSISISCNLLFTSYGKTSAQYSLLADIKNEEKKIHRVYTELGIY